MSDKKSPWGNGGGGKGGSPWGNGGGPRGGPGKPDRNKPRAGENSPDLDNVIQGFKSRVRNPRFGGGGTGGSGGNGFGPLQKFGPLGLFLIFGLIALFFSCIYQVSQQQEAVILRFGEYSRTSESGLHLKLPTPVETSIKVNVTQERVVGSAKNLVLTGDENIAEVDFTVRWNVKDSKDFLFNLEKPDDVVEDAADSAVREVIGKKSLESVITTERNPIEIEVKALLQNMLDEYGAGVAITVVQLQNTAAPPKVIKAFEDVVTAEQELEQRVNEGIAYRNEVTERAIGNAAKLVEAAEAYKQEVVEVARGEADRFLAVYQEYKAAPRVTRQRIYLETLEAVYADADKIILDEAAGSGVVPYLPLDQLNRPKSGGQ